MKLYEELKRQARLCRANEKYKCAVFVRNSEKIQVVINEIKRLIPIRYVQIITTHERDRFVFKFNNDSVILIIRPNENNIRGYRFNELIIDNEINNIESILPYVIFENIFNEKRIHYVNINYDNLLSEHENNCIKFEKEYESMFYGELAEGIYSKPIVEKELNGIKVLLYNACGIPKSEIKYSTEFINRTKEMYLNITGENKIEDVAFSNKVNVHLYIDTDEYDGYEVNIEDGLVKVTLYEIKNEEPVLIDHGV